MVMMTVMSGMAPVMTPVLPAVVRAPSVPVPAGITPMRSAAAVPRSATPGLATLGTRSSHSRGNDNQFAALRERARGRAGHPVNRCGCGNPGAGQHHYRGYGHCEFRHDRLEVLNLKVAGLRTGSRTIVRSTV